MSTKSNRLTRSWKSMFAPLSSNLFTILTCPSKAALWSADFLNWKSDVFGRYYCLNVSVMNIRNTLSAVFGSPPSCKNLSTTLRSPFVAASKKFSHSTGVCITKAMMINLIKTVYCKYKITIIFWLWNITHRFKKYYIKYFINLKKHAFISLPHEYCLSKSILLLYS